MGDRGIDGKTKCGSTLPNWSIRETVAQRWNMKSDCRKTTEEVLDRRRAEEA